MKKLFVIASVVLLTSASYAQVFNTATTLGRGKMAIGVNPAIATGNGNSEFMLIGHFGYGLGGGLDIDGQVGFNYFNETMIGADIEWTLKSGGPAFSIAGGLHLAGDLALDGTMNLSFPLGAPTLYAGLDLDVIMVDGNPMPVWAVVGLEFGVARRVTILAEGAIGVNDEATTIVSFGFNFYM